MVLTGYILAECKPRHYQQCFSDVVECALSRPLCVRSLGLGNSSFRFRVNGLGRVYLGRV